MRIIRIQNRAFKSLFRQDNDRDSGRDKHCDPDISPLLPLRSSISGEIDPVLFQATLTIILAAIFSFSNSGLYIGTPSYAHQRAMMAELNRSNCWSHYRCMLLGKAECLPVHFATFE